MAAVLSDKNHHQQYNMKIASDASLEPGGAEVSRVLQSIMVRTLSLGNQEAKPRCIVILRSRTY
eukprot:9747638-Prorocentrum_lima.AAC.1